MEVVGGSGRVHCWNNRAKKMEQKWRINFLNAGRGLVIITQCSWGGGLLGGEWGGGRSLERETVGRGWGGGKIEV